ncbi:hypothetical protein M406DRAFT_56993, partial [Cryphonectria parasitica EP155]
MVSVSPPRRLNQKVRVGEKKESRGLQACDSRNDSATFVYLFEGELVDWKVC